jgi:hypothetical protein
VRIQIPGGVRHLEIIELITIHQSKSNGSK